MTTLTGFLSLAGLAGVGLMLGVLASLSARLGAVTKMRPLYRLFWVGIASVVVAAGGRAAVIAGLVGDRHALFSLLAYYVPLSFGLGASVGAAWLYWRWLLRE